MDQLVLRGNVTCNNQLTVTEDFDVNGVLTIAAASGDVTGMGSLGCGAVTSTGAVQGSSLTDGTLSIEMGGITGLDTLMSTGAIESGGDLTCGSFTVTQMDGSIGSGAITSTAAVQGTSVTDGTASLASGSLSSCVNGTFSGLVSSSQLKNNQSSTISSDGSMYTQASNAPDNGACLISVTCHTDDDACGIWHCTKTTGNAGTMQKLGGEVGTTSSYGLVGQWLDMEKPSFKYTTSWGGGTTEVAFKATILGTG